MTRVPPSENLISLLLMLLLATQVMATDLYLPALPQIAGELGVATGAVQWTLTAYILSFGFMQLLAGSLADRYGRRRTLLWSLSAYVAAGVLAAVADDLPLLLCARIIQGAATAGCVISARAIIRDQYSAHAGLGIMARSLSGMSVIGVVCPVLGGVITQYFGWHSTLALVALYGALLWLAVRVCLGYAERPASADQALHFLDFLRVPKFVFSALLAGVSFSGALAFLILSPFVFIGEFGLSRIEYGVLPALCSLAFLIGTIACRAGLKRWTVPQVVACGGGLSLFGGVAEFLLWKAGYRGVLALALPQCIYMLGHGFHQPCGQGGAVAPFPACAGRAAALSGFLLTVTAFTVGQIISHSNYRASQTLVLTMLSLAVLLAALSWLAIPYAYCKQAE